MAGSSRRPPLRISRRERWELEVAIAEDMVSKLEENYWLQAESWRQGMLVHWRGKLKSLLAAEPPKETVNVGRK